MILKNDTQAFKTLGDALTKRLDKIQRKTYRTNYATWYPLREQERRRDTKTVK